MAGKKKLGADLPPGTVDEFNDWADACNYTRSGAAAAGLKLLQIVPLVLRDLALRGQWGEVDRWCRRVDFLFAEDAVKQAAQGETGQKAPRPVARRKAVGGKR